VVRMQLQWWSQLWRRTRIRKPKFGKDCWSTRYSNRKRWLRIRSKLSYHGELLSFLGIHLGIQWKSKWCMLWTLSLRMSHGIGWLLRTWSQLLGTLISIPRSWKSWSLDIFLLKVTCTKLETLSIQSALHLHPGPEQWLEVRCKWYCNPRSDNHCRLE
jgi:hypothetical protein